MHRVRVAAPALDGMKAVGVLSVGMGRVVLTVGLVLTLAAMAGAEELQVMSAGAVEPGLVAAARAFERSSGHRVVVRFGTGPQLAARLEARESADVLIAPAGVMDAAVTSRAVDVTTRRSIGRVGVGVVVRADAASPNIASPAALKEAIGAASSVVFNRASTGQYVERLLVQLGMADVVAPKAVRVDTGEAVIERIAAGRGNEIGFGATTEIRMLESKGVRLVGALPPLVQNFTVYDAGIMAVASARASAAAFLEFLTGASARSILSLNGVEPVP